MEHERLSSVSVGTEPAWLDDELAAGERSPLPGSTRTDVVVVGAGIAGLSVAYHLAVRGHHVVVLDAGRIGGGETGRTSAHLSSALDDRFVELERLHGREGARLAADSHSRAIDFIEHVVLTEGIDCDFQRVDGYLYLGEGDRRDTLVAEAAAAARAGLEVELLEVAPGPAIGVGPALRFARQAQIHPLRYLHGLAAAIEKSGGRIHCGDEAIGFEGGKNARVVTRSGASVSASAIVVATNTPVNNRLTIHTKQAGYRSYVLSLEVPEGTVPRALYWDTSEPYHYVRVARSPSPGTELLIVGGADHRTGEDHDPAQRWERLETWARQRVLQAGRVVHRWSGQVWEPVDALAFIGRNPGDDPNVFIVTGDSGHGLTHGTIAGLLIPRLCEGESHPWAEIYDPRRMTLGALGTMAKETFSTAVHYADWVRPADVPDEADIPLGEGATMMSGGRRLAVYKDEDGRCHHFSAACTHLGGVVAWNKAERSWDCPCHGSRFSADGHVIEGPAQNALRPAVTHEPEPESDTAIEFGPGLVGGRA